MGLLAKAKLKALENQVSSKHFMKTYKGYITEEEMIAYTKTVLEEAAGKSYEQIQKGSLAEVKKYIKRFNDVNNKRWLRKEGLIYETYKKVIMEMYETDGKLDQQKVDKKIQELEEELRNDEDKLFIESYYESKNRKPKKELPQGVKFQELDKDTVECFNHANKVKIIPEEKKGFITSFILDLEHLDIRNEGRFSIELPTDKEEYEIEDKELVKKIRNTQRKILEEYGERIGRKIDRNNTDDIYDMIKDKEFSIREYDRLQSVSQMGSYPYIEESIAKVEEKKLKEELKDYAFYTIQVIYNPLSDSVQIYTSNSSVITLKGTKLENEEYNEI